MKRSEVSIKTRSTPASLSFKGQGTKHTTVKWSIFGYKNPTARVLLDRVSQSFVSIQGSGDENGMIVSAQCWRNKYLESSRRRVMVFDNNYFFRRRISQSELCF